MSSNDRKLQTYFFAALFLAVLLLVIVIFSPFFIPLSMAAVLAVLCRPFYERVVRLTGGREGLLAFLTVVATVFFLLVPLALVGTMVFREARVFSAHISRDGGSSVANFMTLAEGQITRLSPGFS